MCLNKKTYISRFPLLQHFSEAMSRDYMVVVSFYFPTFNRSMGQFCDHSQSPIFRDHSQSPLISCWYFQNSKHTNHGYAAFLFPVAFFGTRKKIPENPVFNGGFGVFAEFQGEASSDPFFGGGKGCSKQNSSQLTTTTRW